jgi:S-adenosylmethionine:tRNA ribosyltransferase-isomerase
MVVEVPEYRLPEGAIAQTPLPARDDARLLVALGERDMPRHRHVRDLPEILEPGDLLVVNTTRVLAARLRLRKPTGGQAEVLLVEPEPEGGDGAWVALVRPGRRLAPGTLLLADDLPAVQVGEHLGDGRRRVRLLRDDVMDVAGQVPLPPYIHHDLDDPERYQTVYARRPGSVAAPTAGLHLTRSVLERCRSRGIAVADVDLAVGVATFRPVSTGRVEDHVMHTERYDVPSATMAACRRARRVVAVGTTTVRALESAADGALRGSTRLFITPGYHFSVVDVLLTNFHQPRSTLLVLLEAFCGPRWRDLYSEALSRGYRFLSFGDAMLVGRALSR